MSKSTSRNLLPPLKPGFESLSSKSSPLSRTPLRRLAASLLYVIFPVLYALSGAWFVHIEKDAIYLWDFATYWNQVIQLSNFLKQDGSFWVVLKTVYQSTTGSAYNLLPSLPLVPFQSLGYNPRTGYIVGICFLYLGLLYLVCCLMYSNQASAQKKVWTWLAGGLLCLTSCAIWWPVYRGYVDVAALAFALAGVAFAIRAEDHKHPLLCYFIGGLFLGIAPVTRRAYSFYLRAFVVIFFLLTSLETLRKTRKFKDIWVEIRPRLFFLLGIMAIFVAFYGFFVSSITADKNVHSSYKTFETTWQQWSVLVGWFGVVPLMAYGFGVWVLIKFKRFKGALLAGALASVLGAILQMQTASLGEHHRYILVAGFLTVLSAALGVALSKRHPQQGPFRAVKALWFNFR